VTVKITLVFFQIR